MNISVFGFNLQSAEYGDLTHYFRGLFKAMKKLRHSITYYHPDMPVRFANSELEEPKYLTVKTFQATALGLKEAVDAAMAESEIVIKISNMGLFDLELEDTLLRKRETRQLVLFWDINPPVTFGQFRKFPKHPLIKQIRQFDAVLTYGGGAEAEKAYKDNGAREALSVYNAFDDQLLKPVEAGEREADLLYVGNNIPHLYTPMREYLATPAHKLKKKQVVVSGGHWKEIKLPQNVKPIDMPALQEIQQLYLSSQFVLNLNRFEGGEYPYPPKQTLFNAAGAGACVITSPFPGLEQFFRKNSEVLVAENGKDVVKYMSNVSVKQAKDIGQSAKAHVLAEHTYTHRASEIHELFKELRVKRRKLAKKVEAGEK
jgi:spore maturation protein CgeB